tara:strand:- start:1632 stop:1808 length:177 start_codon:yes stop_codon:yes gene_type:complete
MMFEDDIGIALGVGWDYCPYCGYTFKGDAEKHLKGCGIRHDRRADYWDTMYPIDGDEK